MATTPRRKSSRTTASSRAKKSTTIDLDAVEIEKNADAETSDDNSAEQAAAPVTKTTAKTTRATSTRAKRTGASTAGNTPKTTSKPENREEEILEDVKQVSETDATKTPYRQPAKSGGGFGKMLMAGLIGSVATLGGVGYLHYAGHLPTLFQTYVQNDQQNSVSAEDLASIQTKITELQLKLENQPIFENQTVDLSPLETRLANVENSLANALNALSLAESRLAEIGSNSDSDTTLQLAQQIANIRTDVSNLRTAEQKLAIKLAAIPENTTTGLTLSSDEISSIVAPLLSPLTETMDVNKQDISGLNKQIAAISGRIDEEVISRLENIDGKLKDAATGEQLAKSVAINALKSTLESGESYSSALASVETLTGSLAQIDQLRTTASVGVATIKSLSNEFRDLQSKLLLAASSDGKSGLTDRMMLSIKSLVTISSDEPLDGNTPEAIISRIDAGLRSGSLSKALVEWNSLPESARSISQGWADRLKNKSEADQHMLEIIKSAQTSSTSG